MDETGKVFMRHSEVWDAFEIDFANLWLPEQLMLSLSFPNDSDSFLVEVILGCMFSYVFNDGLRLVKF